MKSWSTAAQRFRTFFVWRCYVMNFRTVLLIAVYGVFMTGILVRDLWRASYGDALFLTLPIGVALFYFLWPLIWRTFSRRLLGRKEEYPWRSGSGEYTSAGRRPDVPGRSTS